MKKFVFIVVAASLLVLIASCAITPPPSPGSGEPLAPTATQPPPTETPNPTETAAPTQAPTPGYLNLTVEIDGNLVEMVDGYAEIEAAPGSSSKIITRFFGNEAFGDLNGDGKTDAVFLLTQQAGGSGTFYFVAAALSTGSGYQGTNAVLLGDRIAPQSTQVENGVIVVNYADRNPGEDFSVQPSLGVTKTILLQDGVLVEKPMTSQVTNRPWKWVRTQMNDGTVISPKQPGVFTLTFGDDGNVNGTTDCNSFFGSYSMQDGLLSFGPLAMTKMYCQDSQEAEFIKYLVEVQSYLVLDGQLVLEIKYDSGQLIFE